MDFRNIPQKVQPAYAWFWNSTITKEGIDRQLDEMQKNGIGAMYVIGEPEQFRPNRRATHLSPEYLSDAYLDLLLYASEKAKKKGIYVWLYNEGGYPSGSACGLVTKQYPELMYKNIGISKFSLEKGQKYQARSNALAAFVENVRIPDGYEMPKTAEICEYYPEQNRYPEWGIRVDIADRRGTEEFIKITHERMKKWFGDRMGTDIVYMFDDEANMGGWTKNFDKIFMETYGYDMRDFLPVIATEKAPVTEEEYRAVSDYIMLCGELFRDNYLTLMRLWLHKTDMLSIGHLNMEDDARGAYINRYGNILKTMRAYDVPGIDVIWGQIAYPENGTCCPESMEMFPRLASSAARQIGKQVALSESFAVYGAHVMPDLMRFVVNFQAVRGINLFNFMAMSYDRTTPMRHQFRPNFIGDNVGMDCLRQINNYTARLSYIMQQGKAVIHTALYYPLRSICAMGEKGEDAVKSFEKLGKMLEDSGVSFDFIDEDFVLEASIEDGVLAGEFAEYKYVFVPDGAFEMPEVTEKLAMLPSEIHPDIKRKSMALQSRKVVFDDGSEGYFLFNQGDQPLLETVKIQTENIPYEVDLFTGEVLAIPFEKCGEQTDISVNLLRGEGVFLWLAGEKQNAPEKREWETVCEITDITSAVTRIYELDVLEGVRNSYPEPEWKEGLLKWERSFSGEVTYLCRIPDIDAGAYRLYMENVRHYAKIYVNGKKVGEATMPPYAVVLEHIRQGDELKIVVANTPANACVNTDYFEKHLLKDVGRYHATMVITEGKEEAGGLGGPIFLERKR